MDIEQFVDIARIEPVVDVVLVGVLDSRDGLTRFSQADRGPLCLLFESSSVMLEQPPGREEIELTLVDLNSWMSQRQRELEEWQLAVFSMLEIVFYPFNEYSPPPRVDRICGFRNPERERLGGMSLTLSTGGTIGVDTSSDVGLTYFFDGHSALYQQARNPAVRLDRAIIWERE